MTLSFYLDEDLSAPLGASLRAIGYDALHTREVGNDGVIDPRQLAFAVRQGRVLVTSNFDDLRLPHEAWLVKTPDWDEGATLHPGVVVLPNPNAATVVTMTRLLDEFARGIGAGDIRNRHFRWRATAGWEDLLAVRGRPGRSG